MAGPASATLFGCVLPAQNASAWDHTYVASSCGHDWDCFGRSQFGHAIVSGSGNLDFADCLSHPRRQNIVLFGSVYAAIIYGVTGACHQAANRILYAVRQKPRVKVSAARGFGVSYAVYGDYGLLAWPERAQCLRMGRPSTPGQGSLSNIASSYAVFTPQYGGFGSDSLMSDYETDDDVPAEGPEERIDKIAAFYEASLSHPLPDALVQQLFAVKVEFRERQESLMRKLDHNEISRENYLRQFNAALAKMMEKNRELLGDSDFSRVYGEAGFQPEGLVNPNIFFADHNAA